LQPDRVLLRNTNRSFSRLVGALLAETGAGSELRANAPAVAVPTATRAPVGGRRSPARVGGSAAWLRGGGL